MRIQHLLPAVAGLWSICLFGQTPPGPTIAGTWLLQSDSNEKLVLEHSGDKIHVQEFKGPELKSDFSCSDDGKDCSVKEGGHSEKVSFYFNGPKLVELETRGDNVIQRHFALAGDGKSLEVEMVSISPPGKPDKMEYSRAN